MRIDDEIDFEGYPKAKIQRACQQAEIKFKVETRIAPAKYSDYCFQVFLKVMPSEVGEAVETTRQRADQARGFIEGWVFGS